MEASISALEVVTNAVTELESVTIDLCCAGHTAYVADMSTCATCGQQFCPKHDCSCPVAEEVN
jgi:hypothetical protein